MWHDISIVVGAIIGTRIGDWLAPWIIYAYKNHFHQRSEQAD